MRASSLVGVADMVLPLGLIAFVVCRKAAVSNSLLCSSAGGDTAGDCGQEGPAV